MVDQVDGVEEPHPLALMDSGDAQSGGQVGFTGSGATDQNHVVRFRHEAGRGELFDPMLCQRRFMPVEVQQVAMDRKASGPELIVEAA